MLCKDVLAPAWLMVSDGVEAGSVQMAIRLPMLQSDWLVSDVSEEPDMLRSSPPGDGQYEDETAEKYNINKSLMNPINSFNKKTLLLYVGSYTFYNVKFKLFSSIFKLFQHLTAAVNYIFI